MNAQNIRLLDEINEKPTFSYLDKHGGKGARGQKVRHVELVFGDERVRLTKQEMAMIKDVEFRLSESHE